MRTLIAIAALLVSWPVGVTAQARFNYPDPAAGAVTVTRDLEYGRADTAALRMDVYRPAGGGAAPALIFFNAAVGPARGNAFYAGWAQAAASKGLVAIVPDLHGANLAPDFRALIAHLNAEAGAYGIDRNRIAVYAGSGNVSAALPLVQDPAMTAVKAAVVYYGNARVSSYRRDLPVLMVRAGLDRPALNAEIIAMASQATAQNAPFTLVNHPFGYHAFEIANADAATPELIELTIDFVKRATAPSYQSALRSGLAEATAAAHVATANFSAAAASYAQLVDTRPDDLRLRLAYGEALLGDRQFALACTEFEKLKGKGLGARDLGLPAARACLNKGDPDAAMAWLSGIPRRFLPPSVQTDPAFAALRERADFRALFAPQD